ncbi:MAG: phosphoglucosamine mutase [Pirellulaceae bacterium]|nr:MAG: phosphoglucosamine mutase [Pirellulaceae bacterium]
MNEPIISVSGLRGIVGAQLNPTVASTYTAALASHLPQGIVILGRDSRPSGEMFSRTIAAVLQAHGHDVIDLGIAATPTIGVEVRRHHAVAGIQISASHNPPEYNGMKLFGADGRVINRQAGDKVLQAYRNHSVRWVNVEELGTYAVEDAPHAAHLEKVLSTISVAPIQRRAFRVLLDCNRGAGGMLGRRLLEELGCQVDVLGETPDGRFEHPPEPTMENLAPVCDLAKSGTYDVVFCQDPDADRLAVIDERGTYIGEELTLALCLLDALPKKPGTVVTNCATSSLSKLIAAQFNCRLIQAAVGEANVADLMIEQGAVFGGEGNGGPIDPEVGYVRDSFVGMARVLSLLASTDSPLSVIVEGLPKLAMYKDKAAIEGVELRAVMERLMTHFADAQSSMPDGLKLEWPDRWLLVRGSNTEPIVRLIAEAPTVDQARDLCQQARTAAGL